MSRKKKEFKVDERLKRELTSLFNPDGSIYSKHYIIHDYDLLITGWFGKLLPTSWHEALETARRNRKSKAFDRNISRIAVFAWLELGSNRYEISKREFIASVRFVLSEVAIQTLTDKFKELILAIDDETFSEMMIRINTVKEKDHYHLLL